jgi:acetyl-CoA acetyltransferase family protein
MAITAENCAAKYGVSREAQDAFALRSQQLADAAWREGRFADEVVPVEVKTRKGVDRVTRDDHMRPQTTLEGLAKLPTAFKKDGSVTAGNASGIVDGAAAIILASEEAVNRHGLKPLGRLVDWASVGVEPSFMGMGPAPATRAVMARTGLKLDDFDLIELNEAFAGQYLSVEKELGLNRDRVNVNGGAIALGHPLGMTGTRLILTLLLELRRRKAKRGLATACIGGGQGIAAVIEAL